MSIRYAGQVAPQPVRYWYAGTDELKPGYAMCLDLSASPGVEKTSLGKVVTKPATANLTAFAGFVAEKKTGPCFVDLVPPIPGQAYEVHTNANMTKNVTGLAPQDASYALAAHSDSALNLPLCAVAAETHDSSVTPANKWVVMK